MSLAQLLEQNREQIANAVLNEIGLSREDAVKQLASQLGVDLTELVTADTDNAKTVSEEEIRTLREASRISARLFGG